MKYMVNKSGNGHYIYDLGTNEIIGVLENGESCFLLNESNLIKKIQFCKENLAARIGYISKHAEIIDWLYAPYYYSKGKKIFKIRHATNIYEDDGSYCTQLNAGDLIYTDVNMSHLTNLWWMKIRGYKEKQSNFWSEFKNSYGYIDINADMYGLGSSEISVYGDW